MTGLLRFLAFLLLALLARIFLSSWLRPARSVPRPPQPKRSPERAIGAMLRDPQCGTHVAPELAISANAGGETIHFCSEKCRDLYLGALQ